MNNYYDYNINNGNDLNFKGNVHIICNIKINNKKKSYSTGKAELFS